MVYNIITVKEIILNNKTEKVVCYMNELKNAMAWAIGAMVAEEQNKVCSKVDGRENYIIHLTDGKVDFYGTKGQFLNSPHSGWVLLREAYHYNTFRFTYKKDYKEALAMLGVNVK